MVLVSFWYALMSLGVSEEYEPVAHSCIFRRTKNVALTNGVPGETVALSRLASQHDIRTALSVAVRLVAVLGAIKHIRKTTNGTRSNQVTVLRAVPSAIDLALVVDALRYLDARRC